MQYFKGTFEIRADNSIETFLGLSVVDEDECIRLHHAPVIERLVVQFKMKECETAPSQLQTGIDLNRDDGEVIADETPYTKLTGALLPLSSTVRPDICFAVGYLSRFMHRTTTHLWKSAKHILRYFRYEDIGTVLLERGASKLEVYSDADWEQERPSQKSVSATIFKLAGRPLLRRKKSKLLFHRVTIKRS